MKQVSLKREGNQAVGFDIRPLKAEETRWLRHIVLKPFQAPETLIYPGDNAADSLHVGSVWEGRLVGIASVSRQAPPHEDHPAAWQLRGMTTLPEVRRQGHGAALIGACITHVAGHAGTLLWCNARTSAIPFYAALGFVINNEVFEVPHTGPHVVMRRTIDPAEV